MVRFWVGDGWVFGVVLSNTHPRRNAFKQRDFENSWVGVGCFCEKTIFLCRIVLADGEDSLKSKGELSSLEVCTEQNQKFSREFGTLLGVKSGFTPTKPPLYSDLPQSGLR